VAVAVAQELQTVELAVQAVVVVLLTLHSVQAELVTQVHILQ
jgi:hypothetical protein